MTDDPWKTWHWQRMNFLWYLQEASNICSLILKEKCSAFCTFSLIMRIFMIIYDVLQHYSDERCSHKSWSLFLTSLPAVNIGQAVKKYGSSECTCSSVVFSIELQLSGLRRSSYWRCRTLNMIVNILIIRLQTAKNQTSITKEVKLIVGSRKEVNVKTGDLNQRIL